jgi:ankyrin repeat protein
MYVLCPLNTRSLQGINQVQANPKLAQLKDDDGRLPIHWAVSYNQPEIVSLLISQKGFDPDAEVRGFILV